MRRNPASASRLVRILLVWLVCTLGCAPGGEPREKASERPPAGDPAGAPAIQRDLQSYYEQMLPIIGRNSAICFAYGSIASGRVSEFKIREFLEAEVLPSKDVMDSQAAAVAPVTKTVRTLHDIFLTYCRQLHESLVKHRDAMPVRDARDRELLAESNRADRDALASITLWVQEFRRLAKEYGVTYDNRALPML